MSRGRAYKIGEECLNCGHIMGWHDHNSGCDKDGCLCNLTLVSAERDDV